MDYKYFIIAFDFTQLIVESTKSQARADVAQFAARYDGVRLSQSCYLIKTEEDMDVQDVFDVIMEISPQDATTYVTVAQVQEQCEGEALKPLRASEPMLNKPILRNENRVNPRTLRTEYFYLLPAEMC